MEFYKNNLFCLILKIVIDQASYPIMDFVEFLLFKELMNFAIFYYINYLFSVIISEKSNGSF